MFSRNFPFTFSNYCKIHPLNSILFSHRSKHFWKTFFSNQNDLLLQKYFSTKNKNNKSSKFFLVKNKFWFEEMEGNKMADQFGNNGQNKKGKEVTQIDSHFFRSYLRRWKKQDPIHNHKNIKRKTKRHLKDIKKTSKGYQNLHMITRFVVLKTDSCL